MRPTEDLNKTDALARGICPKCGCPNRPWLRATAVARALGCSTRTIRERIRAGRLNGRRDAPRGPWMVEHKSIDDFLGVTRLQQEDGDDG